MARRYGRYQRNKHLAWTPNRLAVALILAIGLAVALTFLVINLVTLVLIGVGGVIGGFLLGRSSCRKPVSISSHSPITIESSPVAPATREGRIAARPSDVMPAVPAASPDAPRRAKARRKREGGR
jgi:hypothetical protein